MLSPTEKTQLRALIAREGGLPAFESAINTFVVDDQQKTAITALAPAITVTVQDWAALKAYVEGPGAAAASRGSNDAVKAVMLVITQAFTARSDAQLGPLFAALFAAVKSYSSM